ncbi:hypothetical protein NA57DRAFT_81792 [Rhizodiscina lignyota]|uniref:UBA domain-containing protein n=1 Tax=Rhizodiscina lignyota TaxID=1504668 RepID=A0A9P4I4P8_9PEZI|nr:hypothetical protein NA57DRAFT_81792 [Rhizodiscina lignyota]
MRNEVQDSDDDEDLSSPIHAPLNAKNPDDNVEVEDALNASLNGTSSTELLRRGIQEAKDALFASNSASKRPRGSQDDAMASANSSTAQRAKRRKTTADVEVAPTLSAKKLERRKTVKTYGQTKSSGQPRSEAGSSAFEALKGPDDNTSTSQSSTRHESEYISAHEAIEQALAPLESEYTSAQEMIGQAPGDQGEGWNLPPTMLQEFAEHSPGMFPSDVQQSSTVPEDTMVQRQLLDDALYMTIVNGAGNIPSARPASTASSSLHLSQFLTTQSAKSPSVAKSDPSKSPEKHSEGLSSDIISKGLPDSVPGKMGPPPLNNGTPQRRGLRSATPKVSPAQQSESPAHNMRSTTPQGSPPTRSSGRLRRTKTCSDVKPFPSQIPAPLLEEAQSSSRQMDPLTEVDDLLVRSSRKRAISNIEKDEAQANVDSERAALMSESNELPVQPISRGAAKNPESDNAITIGSKRAPSEVEDNGLPAAPSRKRGRPESLKKSKDKLPVAGSDELNSDDIAAIGLPKEQYKPRLSRRRSEQVTSLDDIDYSKVPERAARARAKRRKTVDPAAMGEVSTESPNKAKVDMVSSMGFTPARAKKALQESNGSMEAAVESLITGPKTRSKDEASKLTVDLQDESEIAVKSPEEQLQQTEKREQSFGSGRGKRVLECVEIPSKLALSAVEEAGVPAETTLNPGPGESLQPIKKRRSQPKKVEQKEVVLEEPITDDTAQAPPKIDEDELPTTKNAIPADVDEPDDSPPKKRGRRQPRSIQTSETKQLEVHRDKADALPDIDSNNDGSAPKASASRDALAEVDANTKISEATPVQDQELKSDPPPATPEQVHKNATPVTPTSRPRDAAPNGTSSESANARNSAQHSPISKGKVPYRETSETHDEEPESDPDARRPHRRNRSQRKSQERKLSSLIQAPSEQRNKKRKRQTEIPTEESEIVTEEHKKARVESHRPRSGSPSAEHSKSQSQPRKSQWEDTENLKEKIEKRKEEREETLKRLTRNGPKGLLQRKWPPGESHIDKYYGRSWSCSMCFADDTGMEFVDSVGLPVSYWFMAMMSGVAGGDPT